jgi:O-antigen/teichoic acid export membrane protein
MFQHNHIWQEIKNRSNNVANDPLTRNSFFIGVSRAVNKGVGLLFWSVAARYYTIADVGLATAMISSLELIMILSRFGSDISIIRFMPLRDKEAVFNNNLWIPAVLSLTISLIYLATIDILSPDLSFLKNYLIFFIGISLVRSATLTTGYTMISQRWGGAFLGQNLLLSSRVPLLPIMSGLGSMGIFISLGAAYAISLVASFIPIFKMVRLRPKIDRRLFEETFKFSSYNYMASMLNAAPELIFPIMILNILGPAEAARWYVAFSVANIILIIPDAVSTSYFVEGSHGLDMGKGTAKMLFLMFGLLLIPVLVLYIWGHPILGLLGEEYAMSTDLLKVLVLASFFVTIYCIYIPIQNIRNRVEIVALMNFARFILLLGLGYVLIARYGIIGAGYAWMATYALLSLVMVYEATRRIWKHGGTE